MSNRIRNMMRFLLLLAFSILILVTKREQVEKVVKNVHVSIDAT